MQCLVVGAGAAWRGVHVMNHACTSLGQVVKAKKTVVPPSLLGHAVCVGCTPGQWLLGTLGSIDVVEHGSPACVQALAGSPGDTRQLRSGPRSLSSVVRTVVVQAVVQPHR